MAHKWYNYSDKYIYIAGDVECFVRKYPLPSNNPLEKGYLWQVGKKAGYCKTIDQAKATAEMHLHFIQETKSIKGAH